MVIMPLIKEKEKKFTYSDYATWPDDEHWELIDGEAYNMSPAPSIKHQKILGNMYNIISTHPQRKTECFVGIAPLDVVLSEHDVVQPDLLIVCDRKKITEANIQGAPDLVIEVLSPSTALKDRREKKALYEKYGVKEYILVYPLDQYVERYILQQDGSFGNAQILGPDETLQLIVMDEVKIPLQKVFEDSMV
ncbi:MAG: hypothetical protein SRB1_02523 [Desulfobacteraceae bacterium Eth-SRB1]|nr:MAG: hypothetical protein SRB1_02523 [Desulfobacteraceae bacterium Eth-SRB1]